MPRYAIPNDGIVHLTLFDPEGKPLCERLIFAQQNKHINLKILADKATYAPREKITLTLEATDTLGKPVEGAFSLAATDGKQVVTEGYNQNLYSYLLMSSDLKGTVEDPAFYFKDQDIKTRRALDILMMTQGWRRFDWADVLNNQYPTLNHNVEQGLAISGRVLRPNNKISKNVNVTLMVKGIDSKETFLAVATADSLGNFVFPNLNIKDSAQILVQAVKEKGGRNLTIRLNTEGVPTIHFEKPKNQSLTFDAKQLAEFLKRTSDKIAFERKLRLDKEQLLNAVEITAKRKKSEDSRRALYGSPSKSIDFTGNNCTNYTSIYSAIQMNIPNVQTAFNSETGITSLSIRGGDVEYLLDGMKTDATFIDGIQPCEIEAIDILRGAEALSVTSGSSAVISILTRRGNASYDYGQDEALGIITRRYNGFVTPAEFYAPKYNIKKPEHEFMDYRSTLHWQPNVKTDANGKAKVEFWASDAMTNVRVVAEGRSNKGQIGVGISQFIVKN